MNDVADRQREALLMDINDAAAALAIGARTLRRWVSSGAFPHPDLTVGGKIRRWKRATILEWIESNGEGAK